MITSIADLADEIGCPPTVGSISKALFKSTDCGICFGELAHGKNVVGISIAGYAEGADAECAYKDLTYPFTPAAFWEAVSDADQEGVDMWEEWNIMDIEAGL